MMKSKISIEVDFDNSNLPVIQIIDINSDDVRDKLVSSFLQSLAHTSRWCKILFIDNLNDTTRRWKIVPLAPNDLPEEVRLIGAVLESDYLINYENIRPIQKNVDAVAEKPKHLKASDLIKALRKNPDLCVRVAETKKHDDNAPTMAVLDVEMSVLNDGDGEEVFLLWVEPNPDTELKQNTQ